ncbi:MAG: hypothetical protein AB7P04_04825 [Bacteriovoracia bacterium]
MRSVWGLLILSSFIGAGCAQKPSTSITVVGNATETFVARFGAAMCDVVVRNTESVVRTYFLAPDPNAFQTIRQSCLATLDAAGSAQALGFRAVNPQLSLRELDNMERTGQVVVQDFEKARACEIAVKASDPQSPYLRDSIRHAYADWWETQATNAWQGNADAEIEITPLVWQSIGYFAENIDQVFDYMQTAPREDAMLQRLRNYMRTFMAQNPPERVKAARANWYSLARNCFGVYSAANEDGGQSAPASQPNLGNALDLNGIGMIDDGPSEKGGKQLDPKRADEIIPDRQDVLEPTSVEIKAPR